MKTLYLYPAHDVDDFIVLTSAGLDIIRDGGVGVDAYRALINESSIAAKMMTDLGAVVKLKEASRSMTWQAFDGDAELLHETMAWNEAAPLIAGASCNVILGDIVSHPKATETIHSLLIQRAANSPLDPFRLAHLEYGCPDHNLWNNWIGD